MSNDAGTAMAGDPKRYVDIALLLYTYTHKTMAVEEIRKAAKGRAGGLETVAFVLKRCPDMVESMDDDDLAKETGLEGYRLGEYLSSYDEL